MDEIRGMPGWRRVRSLGAGSYGTVYEIQKEQSGHLYRAALKVMSIPRDEAELHTAYADGMDEQSASSYFSTLVDAISSECAMMYELSGNTNIVAYQGHEILPHDNGIGADILIRMELLQPLTEYISNTALSEADVIRLGTDLCRALELCEKRDIVHRDVKPANIFVSKNGDYKLGDFGIARTMSTHGTMTSKRGTYTYMAPEVYFGKKDYDHTADLYSLGLVLYWCLNERRLPFEPPAGVPLTARDRENALDERLDGQPIPRPVQCSDELWEVIRKASAFDKRDRFQRAGEMRAALEKCLPTAEQKQELSIPEDRFEKEESEPDGTVGPDQSAPASDNPEKSAPGKRKKRLLAILAALVLLAGAAIGIHYAGNHKSAPSQATEQTESEDVSQQPDADSDSEMLVLSPNVLLRDTQSICRLREGSVIVDGMSKGIAWESSDPSILSEAEGVLTAHAAGTVTLRAEYEGASASKEIRVTDPIDSKTILSSDVSDIQIRNFHSGHVQITVGGEIPEHYGMTAYPSRGSCGVEWGELQDNTAQMDIFASASEETECDVYVLLYTENDPTHVVAYTVIHVMITD